MNGYTLTRNWYNYKFENPKKVRPIHSDVYFYIVDLWNRLGQKKQFGLPTSVTMECLGIGSYNTYKKALNDVVEFGFLIIVADSKNQHLSKIVALSIFDKATDKALDKATAKATDKASDEPTDKATDTIIEQENNRTKEQLNKGIYRSFKHLKIFEFEFEKLKSEGFSKNQIDEILDSIENYKKNTTYTSLYLTAKKWLKKEKQNGNQNKNRNNGVSAGTFGNGVYTAEFPD